MYIELFGSSDRLGGNIVDMISQIIYAHKNNLFVKYDRNFLRVYNSYNQHYNTSIFMQTLFDIIDEHNSKLTNEDFSSYLDLAAPSHFEVLSKTTINIEEDLVTYFKNNLFTENIGKNFIDKANLKNYTIPFDPKKTILIHHRLEDVADRPDYDGTICVDFMRDKIENGLIPNNEVLTLTEPSPWCQMQAPLSSDKIINIVNKILKEKPDHEVIIVTKTNQPINDLPFKILTNDDEFYDLYLLCNSETLILSKSNFALSSLFFGLAKEVYVPLWGHVPCYGLYSKFDKKNFKYFV